MQWTVLRLAVPTRRLPKLQTLDLSSSRQVVDADLQALRCVGTLRTLNLQGCEDVSDAGLAAVAQLPALASLSLHNCCKVRKPVTRLSRASPTSLIPCWPAGH